jgi:hypothetical protein
MIYRNLTLVLLMLAVLNAASCAPRMADSSPSYSVSQSARVAGLPPLLRPMITLAAAPMAVEQGDNVKLSWRAENATSVRISALSTRGFSELGDVEMTGTLAVAPTHPTIYTVTASGPGGTTTEAVHVAVNIPPI